jgi:hypothetical protein
VSAGTTTTYAYDRPDRLVSVVSPAPASSTRLPTTNYAGWTSSANAYTSDNVYATTAPNKNNTRT